MPQKILQLIKYYKANAPLLNDMARTTSGEFEIITCYLGGFDDGENAMNQIATKTLYQEIPKKKLYWSSGSTLKTLAKVIDENEIDLVVCQFRRTIPIGVIASRLSKRKPKMIAALHGIVGGKNSFSRKLINFFTYRHLDKIVSVSEFGVSDILKQNFSLNKEKVVAVPNGLNCEKFLQQEKLDRKTLLPQCDEEDFVFCMVGRLAPVKNHVRVLHAVTKIKDRIPNAKLIIAGKGPVENQLRVLIDELDLSDCVKLIGFRQDIPAILRVADAYLMPSVREGLPMALMEAMVSELPVITSNRAGMRELVPDDSIGYLVDPDSIDSIANGMLKAYQATPEEREEKKQRARDRILNIYASPVMIKNYESLYREVLGK